MKGGSGVVTTVNGRGEGGGREWRGEEREWREGVKGGSGGC